MSDITALLQNPLRIERHRDELFHLRANPYRLNKAEHAHIYDLALYVQCIQYDLFQRQLNHRIQWKQEWLHPTTSADFIESLTLLPLLELQITTLLDGITQRPRAIADVCTRACT
jgi:hypothetical protein